MGTLLFLLVPLYLIMASVFMQAQQPVQPSDTVLLLIPIIAGGLGVPLVNFIKNQLGWTGSDEDTKKKNIWLTFGCSAVLAVLLLLITGAFVVITVTPEIIIGWLTLIFAVSQLVYKSLSKPSDQPAPPIPPAG